MMEDNQKFFIDTLGLMPVSKSTVLLVHAPYDDLNVFFEKVSQKKYGVFRHINLIEGNIGILLYEIVFREFCSYIQSLEIVIDGTKIFEGYDGMEYGMFSKEFILPNDFKKEYMENEMCMISIEW